MKTVSHVNYDKPRILAIDFSQNSVNKFKEAGFNVRRAFTGILKEDNHKFCIPCSISDCEIIIFRIRKGALEEISNREIHLDSVETDPNCLKELLKDVWYKNGLSILLIDHDVNPIHMDYIGLRYFGVMEFNREYIPASHISNVAAELAKMGKVAQKPIVLFPRYKGEEFNFEKGKIAEIYEKYLKYGDHIVFCTSMDFEVFGNKFNQYPKRIIFHARDGSSNKNPIIVELTHWETKRSIILLPNFENKTDDVVIELIEYAREEFEHLFSEPNFSWIENYIPSPVQKIIDEKEVFIEHALKMVNEFEEKITQKANEYDWMNFLLIGKDSVETEPFKKAVIVALEFLGFEVIDVDLTLTDGTPKREDIRIYDKESEYFAICELKTTDSGAKEQMYRDLQKHMLRYMRETKDTNVVGILIVNHSIRLEPTKRHVFYKSQHIQEELNEIKVSAIDSVFLHDLCQKVFREEISTKDARDIIRSGKDVMSL